MQVDVHTALGVGETHLKQCGDETTGADVVACHYPAPLYHLLHGVECIGEILRVLHRRHVVAHLAEALCESTSAEHQFVEREVDMIDRRILVVHYHRRYHLAHVAHFAAARHDDSSRRDDLLAVRILLRERQRVLSCRHVDVESAAEVAERLHCSIETGVLALL